MKETLANICKEIKEYWTSRTGNQKMMIIGSFLTVFIFVSSIVYFTTKTNISTVIYKFKTF